VAPLFEQDGNDADQDAELGRRQVRRRSVFEGRQNLMAYMEAKNWDSENIVQVQQKLQMKSCTLTDLSGVLG